MIKVYIASPYTKGDVAVNVKVQMDMADKLMSAGFAPFTPLYSHFQHMAHPRAYEDWIKIDLVWVKVCDCVLRLEGESSGADGEVEYAKKLGIPVYYSLEELMNDALLREVYSGNVFCNCKPPYPPSQFSYGKCNVCGKPMKL